MVGGFNIFDTAQTGEIREDKIPACVRVINNGVKCGDVNDCFVETCYFRNQDRDPLVLMKSINKSLKIKGRKEYLKNYCKGYWKNKGGKNAKRQFNGIFER